MAVLTRPRRIEGSALLVAGHTLPNEAALDASVVHTLGQIGEVLLATGAQWQIRRLTAATGERYAPDRAAIKRHLDELVAEPARVSVIVILGTIVMAHGEPALVTGANARQYPEDASLPLAWIRDRLLASRAEQTVLALSGSGDASCGVWLEALATRRPSHVIAVESPELGQPMLEALLSGLCGDALDRRTGTVTMASLSEHVARLAPRAALQASRASETVAQPPPLAGLWDVRRSQLANPARPRPTATDDDLTGSVLPGRFRIDLVVARGTFGTVYRARQLAIERDVAVKVLHANIDPSSEDGRLFVHEIRSVGRIDHANVVRIYQADIAHDGRLFFAMELLDGRDLQQVGADGALAQPRAVGLVCQLLAGLAAAHDAGLVHADVKPANAIIVARDGEERVVLVDFGLARLRAPDAPAESAGGTPAYMAPEQLQEGRVDARSDLFSAALVLVFLLTGWRRPTAFTFVPPLDKLIEDRALRDILARALSIEPAKRYATARELHDALANLAGETPSQQSAPPPVVDAAPFHHLAPLTSRDRDRLHGRQADLATLAEHVLFRRSVIYTAPSGAGKTSLLCAGLLPRLEALGVHAIYLRCRANFADELATAIAPGHAQIADAITAWHAEHPRTKLVIILDQLETALADADFVPAVVAFDRWPADADVCVVLSIREDFLARLVASTQDLEPGMPIVRLPPLTPEGARAAIVGPLLENRLAIEPELLAKLLEDLQRAAAAMAPEMGWGGARAVYPPHLQLVCSVLYEALGPGDATLTLAHYRRLGGFEAIVGEHLDRVLDSELPDGRDVIARDLFLALVTTAQERAMRSERELVAIVGARHAPPAVIAVLEVLRSRGLLVRVGSGGTDAGWELVHDSLVPRVLSWIDRRDLARRRAIELVRYHLRRSRPDEPSLLGRSELRELRAHAGAIAELDAEWLARGAADGAWTPSTLVGHSRRVLRRRALVISAVLGAALAITSVALYRSYREEARAREEARLKALDLGRVTLRLEAFDWDPVALAPVPVPAAVASLRWHLHAPDPTDLEQPGPPLEETTVVHGAPRFVGNAIVEQIEAPGGRAYLVIDRAGCTRSIVPIRQLPGYLTRGQSVPLHVRVPTCAASDLGMVPIEAGPFVYLGLGDPPYGELAAYPDYAERRIDLAAFAIDRTEVTNAAFAQLAGMRFTGVEMPVYPESREHVHLGTPKKPVSFVDWLEARAYCRYHGKELPTSEQWMKALRGGERLPGGVVNPMPRRNLPWGAPREPVPANVGAATDRHVLLADAGSSPGDTSPYGVLDLAGSVMEWTATSTDIRGVRVVHGGNWTDTPAADLAQFTAILNPRAERLRSLGLGLRCAR